MKHSRRGLTLIEVLVCICLLAILVALMLPAVSESREASRRSQCKNNLKQLGLALHNYHETTRTLPPGYIDSPTMNYWGWNTMILPFIDQAPLYNKFTYTSQWLVTAGDTGNNALTVLSMVRCPSDTGSNTVAVPNPSGVAGRSNYPAVSGAMSLALTSQINVHKKGTIGGAFGANSQRNFRDFSDGLSNTIIVGERKSSGGPANNPGGDTIWIGVASNLTLDQTYVLGDCDTTHGDLPNFKSSGATSGTNGRTSFSSFHVGGTHFLLGDGSVRFITENINPSTYANLATINDGAKLGDF